MLMANCNQLQRIIYRMTA